jgi:hypothetical protein
VAAAPKVFKPSELANVEDVEALETQQQPTEPPAAAPEPTQPQPPEPAKTAHEEAVPYERFTQVNERNKALEKELADHREFRTRLDERQKLIREAQAQTEREEAAQRRAAERPDPGLDPIGAELYDLRLQRAQDHDVISNLQNQLNQFGQHYTSDQEQQQFSSWVTNEANSYHQTDPHYFPAAKYAADKRIDFWRSITPNGPPGLAEKLVEGESIMIARLAAQYGGKFAPAVAKLARDWGFAPNPPPQPNAAPRQASPQAQRLQQVQNGQRLQGLGAVPTGGNAAEGATQYRNYGPADIAAMSEREFMQAMANPNSARDLRYAMAKADGFDNGEANY